MASQGWSIIKALLEAYLELKKLGVTLMAIKPSNIFLSEDLDQLLLTGLQDLVWHRKSRLTQPQFLMPYSNRGLSAY